jgi:hypothetical protein
MVIKTNHYVCNEKGEECGRAGEYQGQRVKWYGVTEKAGIARGAYFCDYESLESIPGFRRGQGLKSFNSQQEAKEYSEQD